MMLSKRQFNSYAVSFSLIAGLLAAGFFAPGGFRSIQKTAAAGTLQKSFGKVPVFFEANRGQLDKRVRYTARGAGYTLFLTATDAVYVLPETKPADDGGMQNEPSAKLQNRLAQPQPTRAAAVWMKLVGANPDSDFRGLDELPTKTNYFIGSDASRWRADVPTFSTVEMNGVYPGIDAVWRGRAQGETRYDFVVQPNADPNQIQWRVEGAKTVSLGAAGELLIETGFGVIRQQKPFSYQEADGLRQEIESGFKLTADADSFTVKFEVGGYDRSKPLVIDPSVNLSQLAFSTFLGGGEADQGNAIAVDKAGNVFVTGSTFSAVFPTTAGTFDTSQNGGTDVFVSKLNASGTNLVYSTFLGGSSTDVGYGIAVDASGNAFVTGYTLDGATDYPTTAGAFDTTHNGGGNDAFVSKLNAAGSALTYSTFLGGSSDDVGQGIAADASGNAFVTGYTVDGATDYPTTAGAFDTTHNGGGNDAFVSKLNAAGSALTYSTFLGGSGDDVGYGIAADASGSAFVTGYTFDAATDYPTTAGAFDTTHNGFIDAFVTKLNAAGSALAYSTFLGGSGGDIGYGIAADASGNAFVTGQTFDAATDYPTTAGAIDTTHNGGTDAFASNLNAAGSALTYSTFLGGSGNDAGYGIAADASGNAFVTGYTTDDVTDYPTTAGAIDTTHNGGTDAFASRLNAAGSALTYSTFLGGSSGDVGYGIAADASGNAFVTGSTLDAATDYPTTAEAFQPTHNGGNDAFISKLGDYSIAGYAVDNAGLPLANVPVALSGSRSALTFTDSQGYFGFFDTATGGNFTVAATHLSYNFTPSNFQLNNLRSNQELYFLGRPTSSGPTAALVELGGKVESVVGSIGLPDTTLTLIDTDAPANIRTVTTDALGNYRFTNVRTGNFYLVIPQREGYSFTPGIYQLNYLEELLNVNFVAAPTSPRPVLDFDGDGKTDAAVFRPSEGNWYILQSQNNALKVVRFGTNGDIPVAEDYDGDRRADVAVYRPSEGSWYRLNSSDNGFSAVRFGLAEDKPVPADYDGDGKTDIAVYRPSSGVWHRLNSSDGGYRAVQFGIAEDRPVPADYDGDGKADLTVFREGVWYRLNSSDGAVGIFQFGLAGDQPVAADLSGDGRIDVAVYRPSSGVWYWLSSSDGGFEARAFGISTDIPVPADYNGDGRVEPAVYRGGEWYISNGVGGYAYKQFGLPSDIPIPAIR